MTSLWRRYARWLHTGFPAGTVEQLPEVRADGSCNVPGLYIAGDLNGMPLLKLAADSGTRVVRGIAERARAAAGGIERDGGLELLIVGAGVAGISAAQEAARLGLRAKVVEAVAPFATIADFPEGKPIYTFPPEMEPAGSLRLSGRTKERLLDELRAQAEALPIDIISGRVIRVVRRRGRLAAELADGSEICAGNVLLAVGRSGEYRRLGVSGETLNKVHYRLHNPTDFAGKQVAVVGAGDSAVESAIAIAEAGGQVTLLCRKPTLSRPKPDNLSRLHRLCAQGGDGGGALTLRTSCQVRAIEPTRLAIENENGEREELANDALFVQIGRAAPLQLLRASGVRIRGDFRPRDWIGATLFVLFCTFLYLWKGGTPLNAWFAYRDWFPFNVPAWLHAAGGTIAASFRDPSTLLGTLAISLAEPGFYYALAYTLLVVIFGIRRVRRQRSRYVTWQTTTLAAIQLVPLFLLPYLLLPWAGHNGLFDGGVGGSLADALFPAASYGHGREYWRAFGFLLAWPLFIWNLFTDQPLGGWLAISLTQTFVIIPLLVWRWGKGAYCGWICSCGALAETLGDPFRSKMPHGPAANRLNMAGQVVLAVALLLLLARIGSWWLPAAWGGAWLGALFRGVLNGGSLLGLPIGYYGLVDILLAGIVGLASYFWLSGRVWCRFFCPLAALMHIYARFSRFRILAERAKCISCNRCTEVCHQGIDVMAFASQGRPMNDPQCVRCSACITSCPTQVLSFGDAAGRKP